MSSDAMSEENQRRALEWMASKCTSGDTRIYQLPEDNTGCDCAPSLVALLDDAECRGEGRRRAEVERQIARLEAACKHIELRAQMAESRWDAVVAEASRLAALDVPPLIVSKDELYVPIERYNEVAGHAWRFAGLVLVCGKTAAHREGGGK